MLADKTIRLTIATLSTLLAASLGTACGVGLNDETHPAGAEVAAAEQPISGTWRPYGQWNVVEFHLPGNSRVFTGVLVQKDMVLTGSANLPANLNPRDITLIQGRGYYDAGQTRQGRFIFRHPSQPVALIHLGTNFSYANWQAAYLQDFNFVDNSAPQALVGTNASCYGFDQTSYQRTRRVSMRVHRAATSTLIMTRIPGETGVIEDNDDGVPCFTSNARCGTYNGLSFCGETLLSVALSTHATTQEHAQVAVAQLRPWIAAMTHLAQVKRQWTRDISLHTLPNPYNQNTKMCMDVAYGSLNSGAAINQHGCHGGPAQHFLFDYTKGSNPALVNANSGLCLDLPGGNTAANLQQYACHGGDNQTWTMELFPSGPGLKLVHVRSGLCLSVSNGPNNLNNSAALRLQSCQTNTLSNNHQRWFMTWL
jgi:hypothetical protein